HEHHDLREPGDGIEEHDHGIVGAGRAVADHETGKVDREKARSVHDRRDAKDHQRAGGHERRMQALRQTEPVEHEHDGAPADEPDYGAEHSLTAELEDDRLPRALAVQQEFDQHNGEEHGKRVVAAGFHLDGGGDARAQAQPAGMQQEEHGGGVGRGYHRADQHRLDPVHVEHEL